MFFFINNSKKNLMINKLTKYFSFAEILHTFRVFIFPILQTTPEAPNPFSFVANPTRLLLASLTLLPLTLTLPLSRPCKHAFFPSCSSLSLVTELCSISTHIEGRTQNG